MYAGCCSYIMYTIVFVHYILLVYIHVRILIFGAIHVHVIMANCC